MNKLNEVQRLQQLAGINEIKVTALKPAVINAIDDAIDNWPEPIDSFEDFKEEFEYGDLDSEINMVVYNTIKNITPVDTWPDWYNISDGEYEEIREYISDYSRTRFDGEDVYKA
jgi:hypothetical protein